MRFLILLFLVATSISSLANASKIKVGLAEWEGYTNSDGSGIYLEIISEIFGKDNLSLEFDAFNRAVNGVENKHHDMVIGVFREDVKDVYLPKWYLDYEYPIVAFYDPKRHALNHPQDIYNLTVAWIRGYNFENYLDAKHFVYEVNTIKHGFQLLENRRIDLFIDYRYNLPSSLSEKFSAIEIMPSRPIYVAFSMTEKGKALSKQYDLGMERLRASGKLKQIYGREYQRTLFDTFQVNRPSVVLKTKELNLLRGQINLQDPSAEAILMSEILNQAKTARVELIKMNDVADFENEKTENSCYLNMLKNAKRANTYEFSSPITMYLGHRLYAAKAFSESSSTRLPDLVVGSKKIGLRKGQIYPQQLMEQLAAIPSVNKVFTNAEISTALEALSEGKIDFWLEYPSLITENWHLISEEPIYSVTPFGSPEFTQGRIMCKPSQSTQIFLREVENILEKLKNTGKHKELLRLAMKELSKEQFESLYSRAFFKR